MKLKCLLLYKLFLPLNFLLFGHHMSLGTSLWTSRQFFLELQFQF
uniref:Uncharacterized protein n=1 Tax=Rhizophora mucronata TaxID=61149 RepID=A0A2P2PQ80_RHIMU